MEIKEFTFKESVNEPDNMAAECPACGSVVKMIGWTGGLVLCPICGFKFYICGLKCLDDVV